MPGAGDWRNWALLATLGLVWGASFATTGVAVDALPPLTVVAARLALGAAILIGVAMASGIGLPDPAAASGRAAWLSALGAAVAANAIPFSMLSWAQTHVPSALAGVFMASLPLIVLPLAHVFVPKETLTWTKVVGFLIGFTGVVYLLGFDALTALGGSEIEIVAQIACLAAASGYAVGSIITKRAPPCHPIAFGAAAIGLAATIMLPAAFLFEAPLDAPWSGAALWSVIYLGVFPTALAQILLVVTLRRAGPSFVSLVNYQVPLWAMAFGWLWLGETVPERAGAALALILAGVAISQGLAGRLLRRTIGGQAAKRPLG